MGVLTEYQLRMELKGKEVKEYSVPKGIIITPSALQYLKDNNIQIIEAEKSIKKVEVSNTDNHQFKYTCLNGGYLNEKPEVMTHLYGNTLVMKNHKRIILRGKLDSLESKILETQIIALRNKNNKVVIDLDEILDFVRNILRAEVLEEEIEFINLLGMNKEEIREKSHNPNKYFGISHVLPDYKIGELAVMLNSLRSGSREVELQAINTFINPDGEVTRLDVVTALNRLSSCFYIMFLKFVSGKY